ncbi:hypothetical protein B0T26DRAFT_692840 [Lasiosphaeria miniovina]|uniref:Uncharacterized protein n=1 Tax=Lasiosphaeria miniovina TaxID=1954250 RepID=A0AA40B3K1_9PEZI|nr:uncharacterized protein B0T26DRAFT_692840 [Lasiosphaeria miniovina]KAK0727046.1 hypothetical protein B0T26DRAFT_692840 [Lasiosphaeria miniovina]
MRRTAAAAAAAVALWLSTLKGNPFFSYVLYPNQLTQRHSKNTPKNVFDDELILYRLSRSRSNKERFPLLGGQVIKFVCIRQGQNIQHPNHLSRIPPKTKT